MCFFFKQKTAYEMRISDWSSDVCSSDLQLGTMLERSAGRIDTMPIEAAAAETLTLRRQAIRSIMRDPLLPEALCATGSLARLIAAMTGYDRIGKTVWRDYLRG